MCMWDGEVGGVLDSTALFFFFTHPQLSVCTFILGCVITVLHSRACVTVLTEVPHPGILCNFIFLYHLLSVCLGLLCLGLFTSIHRPVFSNNISVSRVFNTCTVLEPSPV